MAIQSSKTATKLITYKAVCPRIYGQPKPHKPNMPLRPVVPCMTAPTYHLSKFIGNIIQSSITSKYNIKDSFEFCAFINNVQIPESHIMVLFDVVSLFTCIPKELVRRSIFKNWVNITQNTTICLDLFWEAVELCIDCSYFVFEGEYYKQVFGTAMGNPLSPVIADLVMEDILNDAVENTGFSIPYIKKYVDDLFLVLPLSKIDEVREIFNQQHTSIKFTVETETDGRLPFLDMMLIRKEDHTVVTEWYAKPVASGRILNYYSCHPMHTKMNVAVKFAKRVFQLSTNLESSAINSIIHDRLKQNDYPKQITSRIITRINRRVTPNTAMEVSVEDTGEKCFRSLTNIDGLTEQITKTIRKEYPNIHIAHKQAKTVGSILPMVKDRISQGEKSNVVYRIDCADCDACYIGMTTTKLKSRLSGHRSNVRKLQKLREEGHTNRDGAIAEIREKTALVNHAAAMEHSFKLDEVVIVDKTHKSTNLQFLESCHIYNTEKTVNKRSDTENLHATYAGILHTFKNAQNRTKTNHTNRPNTNRP